MRRSGADKPDIAATLSFNKTLQLFQCISQVFPRIFTGAVPRHIARFQTRFFFCCLRTVPHWRIIPIGICVKITIIRVSLCGALRNYNQLFPVILRNVVKVFRFRNFIHLKIINRCIFKYGISRHHQKRRTFILPRSAQDCAGLRHRYDSCLHDFNPRISHTTRFAVCRWLPSPDDPAVSSH